MRLRLIKAPLARAFGWHVLYEARNKVLLGPTALALRRTEDAEVRRLRAVVAPRPALVATVIATYRRPGPLVAAVRSALAERHRPERDRARRRGRAADLPEDPG